MGRPFKLEAVLKHRQYKEESARKNFAEAVRELKRQQGTLAAMRATYEQYCQALRVRQDSGGSANSILLYARYLARLDSEIHAHQKIVATLARDTESKRQALMASLKDRKIIEKLKERHFFELDREERQAEQKLLSDVAISRHQHGK